MAEEQIALWIVAAPINGIFNRIHIKTTLLYNLLLFFNSDHVQSLLLVLLSSKIQRLLEKEKKKASVGQMRALPKMCFRPHKGQALVIHKYVNTMHLGREIIILS